MVPFALFGRCLPLAAQRHRFRNVEVALDDIPACRSEYRAPAGALHQVQGFLECLGTILAPITLRSEIQHIESGHHRVGGGIFGFNDVPLRFNRCRTHRQARQNNRHQGGQHAADPVSGGKTKAVSINTVFHNIPCLREFIPSFVHKSTLGLNINQDKTFNPAGLVSQQRKGRFSRVWITGSRHRKY
jgi:hypothetical protein